MKIGKRVPLQQRHCDLCGQDNTKGDRVFYDGQLKGRSTFAVQCWFCADVQGTLGEVWTKYRAAKSGKSQTCIKNCQATFERLSQHATMEEIEDNWEINYLFFD